MSLRNAFTLNRSVSITIQTLGQSAPPYAARVDVRQVSRYLTFGAIFMAVTSAGTLLFFREMEINRRLQEHVLRLETERGLYVAHPLPQAPTRSAAEAVSHPVAVEETSNAPASSAARINELRADCAEGVCSVKLAMSTVRPGTAAGQILFVLETEVPRIGATNPNTPVRKRFFLSPGESAQDELDPNQLSSLEQKPFRFSRALQTTSTFQVGALLRPLAVNVYVFDEQKNLLLHERKPIAQAGVEP